MESTLTLVHLLLVVMIGKATGSKYNSSTTTNRTVTSNTQSSDSDLLLIEDDPLVTPYRSNSSTTSTSYSNSGNNQEELLLIEDDDKPYRRYAGGTLSAKKGIAKVFEDGPEIITTSKGTFVPFQGGEGVIPAKQTQTLLNLSKAFTNGSLKLQMPDMSGYQLPTGNT